MSEFIKPILLFLQADEDDGRGKYTNEIEIEIETVVNPLARKRDGGDCNGVPVDYMK